MERQPSKMMRDTSIAATSWTSFCAGKAGMTLARTMPIKRGSKRTTSTLWTNGHRAGTTAYPKPSMPTLQPIRRQFCIALPMAWPMAMSSVADNNMLTTVPCDSNARSAHAILCDRSISTNTSVGTDNKISGRDSNLPVSRIYSRSTTDKIVWLGKKL